MRLTGYQKSSQARFDVQMTPMIDVVFQLLIFFVCTVNFQQLERSLPATPKLAAVSAGAATTAPIPPELEDLRQMEVTLARNDGRTSWTVNGDPCGSLDDVERRLTALARVRDYKSIVPVVLDAADDVPLADAIDVYDLALQLGYEKVQFVAPE